MEEALNRLNSGEIDSGQKIYLEAEILEYLAFAMYKQENVKHALQLTDRLYKIGL